MAYTNSTNIRFSTSFEYFNIPLLRICRITPCLHVSYVLHACVVLCHAASFCIAFRRSALRCVVLSHSASFCIAMRRACVRACSVRACMHAQCERAPGVHVCVRECSVCGNLWELVGTYGNLWESSCVFLRYKVFLHNVFSLQGVFYIVGFCCKSF